MQKVFIKIEIEIIKCQEIYLSKKIISSFPKYHVADDMQRSDRSIHFSKLVEKSLNPLMVT